MSELASPGQLRMAYVRVALVVVPLILLLGMISGALAGSGAGSGAGDPWFAHLVKPAAMPPAWLFPVAWTILYVLIGLALASILAARRAPGRGPAVALFAAQLVCNLTWSPLFFAAHAVRPALLLILVLIALTAATIRAFARIRPRAAALMVPYLLWLLFAAFLNQRIDALNPDAATLAPGGVVTQVQL